jgi:phage tail sheath protein FI
LGVFYPSGQTTDNSGTTIIVPPSHMMLRTLANSDNVSYPWFAPAGTRRGVVDNATAVGYIDASEGEFKTISVTESVRDTMHTVKINPITFFSGAGIVNFGNLTKVSGTSALDRINVSRLAVYLRTQLDAVAKPFIFEPNDELTRNEIKQAIESFLLELVGQRALYDFLVVCDDTNNTPTRIDRNELYVDIAVEPVKSVEFIYIPLRIKNTGEIAKLGN